MSAVSEWIEHFKTLDKTTRDNYILWLKEMSKDKMFYLCYGVDLSNLIYALEDADRQKSDEIKKGVNHG